MIKILNALLVWCRSQQKRAKPTPPLYQVQTLKKVQCSSTKCGVWASPWACSMIILGHVLPVCYWMRKAGSSPVDDLFDMRFNMVPQFQQTEQSQSVPIKVCMISSSQWIPSLWMSEWQMAELVVLSTRSNIPQSHTTLLGMYFTLSVAGDNSFWICHAH